MELAITELLLRARTGDRTAINELVPVYDQLLPIAQRVRRNHPRSTLKASAFGEEAWVRLAGDSHPDYESTSHFFLSRSHRYAANSG